MSVPSQASVFSIALQGRKHGDAAFDTSAYQWFKTRATRIGVDVQDLADVFPDETGGPIVPTGAFKMGSFGAGDVEMIPRLERFLGIVLYGAMGKIQSGVNQVWSKATNTFVAGPTGVVTHRFTFDPQNPFFQPWMAVRTMVPGATPEKNSGKVGIDFKVGSIGLTIPAMGLLGLSVAFQGRKMSFPLGASVNAWSYANGSENHLSAPVANKGQFLIGGQEYPIVQASLEIMNEHTDPRQEFVIGKSHIDDIVTLRRRVQVRIVYKWDNPDFYKSIVTNGVNNVDWSAIPFTQDTVGATKAFEATFTTPSNIPGSSPATPYGVSVYANRMFWQLDRQGVQLQAGSIVMVPYVGTFLEAADGMDYVEVILTNNAQYVIPSDPNAPVFTFADTVAYAGPALAMDPAATLTDNGATLEYGLVSLNFNGGDNFNPLLDRITLGAGTSIVGNNVLVGATVVGTVENGAPDAGENLGILLNAAATPATIQTLLRALTYTTTTATSRPGHIVRLTLVVSDGTGGVDTEFLTITHS